METQTSTEPDAEVAGAGAGAGDAAADLWRLSACPGCDFSLSTRPPQGVCPECGRAYDQRFIVLVGAGRGEFGAVPGGGGNWRGFVVAGVAVAILLFMWASGPRAVQPGMLIWPVVAVLMLALHGYVRLFAARDTRMQLWLSPDGANQIASTPEARYAAVIAAYAVPLLLPLAMTLPIADRIGWRRPITLLLLAAAVVTSAAVMWRVRRRLRADDLPPDGPPPLWPWSRVINWSVDSLDGDRARVWLVAMDRWGPINLRQCELAHIEVALTAAQARWLRERIARWTSGNGSAAAP
jgi:hypothetical protein